MAIVVVWHLLRAGSRFIGPWQLSSWCSFEGSVGEKFAVADLSFTHLALL